MIDVGMDVHGWMRLRLGGRVSGWVSRNETFSDITDLCIFVCYLSGMRKPCVRCISQSKYPTDGIALHVSESGLRIIR